MENTDTTTLVLCPSGCGATIPARFANAHRMNDCPAYETQATRRRLASIQVNAAHDAAVGPHPGLDHPDMRSYSAWSVLVFDFWRIASHAVHTRP